MKNLVINTTIIFTSLLFIGFTLPSNEMANTKDSVENNEYAPATPPSPSISNNCGYAIIVRMDPPSGVTYYWQSTSTGTSTANSSKVLQQTTGSPYGTVYYIRARDNSTGQWSSARSFMYYINIQPGLSVPSTPTVSGGCGSVTITRGTPPSGVTWYWQSSPNLTDTSNSSASITKTSGAVQFLRARNNSSGCWSQGAAQVNFTVNSNPDTPSSPTIDTTCGATNIFADTPPTGVTWFWQTSAAGTSTASVASSSSPKTITAGSPSGTIYLRARNNSTGCWSENSRTVSYTVRVIPGTPTAPSVSNNCGSSVLTRTNPPTGVTWYWQSSASGTDTSNSSASITRTSGSTYYLRARHNSSACWSSAVTVNYNIQPLPSTPTAPTVTNNCGNSVFTRSNPPSGITWYWQSSASGTSTSNSSVSITRTSGSVYYLRARNISTGCWSAGIAINYSIKSVPAIPDAATIAINCGSTVLTRSNPPTGITWYWQSSPSGTSTSQSSVSITRTSGGVYYLRARNNSTLCWSEARAVGYTINPAPDAPPTPGVVNNCENTVLSHNGSATQDITWYWQSTGGGTSTANSSTSISLTSGSLYFIRARNDNNGCWSPPTSVSYTINTLPDTPSSPTIDTTCGATNIFAGTPPAGVTWFWQTSAAGTSTASVASSSSPKTITAGSPSGTIYLRARNNSTGCWSENSRTVSYTVREIPDSPPAPSVTNNCGNSVLTRTNPPTGVTWYWQSSASGTDTSNSSASITRTSGSAYYLRARHNSSACWSSAVTVNYSIQSIPSVPTAPTVANNCGNSVLTRSNPPTGITWYWQSSASGTSTSNSSASITLTNGSVYYLRARNNSTGCWSPEVSVSYSIKSVPDKPSDSDISVEVNCGNAILTRVVNPPSGITWYWQNSLSGTSTGNDNESITLLSGYVYYLRGRDNTTGCWGEAQDIGYTTYTPPLPPPTPEVDEYCGYAELSHNGTIPVDVTWYWQSSGGDTSTENSDLSISLTSGSIYFIRARNNNTGCWSPPTSVSYNILSGPDTPPTPTVDPRCGATLIYTTEPPSGVTYYWQTSADDTSTASQASSSSPKTITAGNPSATIYLRAKDNISECWSENSRAVSYTVREIPDSPPAPSVQNYFGYAELTRGTPPANETWYWQSSELGESTANSNTTVTVSSGNTYFLRAKNNNSACWGPAVSVEYNFEDYNWIASNSFDIQGNLKTSSKTYYDDLGKPTQSQTLDIKTNKVWASQTFYDRQGRPGIQTLSAPIKQGAGFIYKDDFVKAADGTSNYNFVSVFNGTFYPVGSTSNELTLGRYYSENNSEEPYQDVTDYPLFKTSYDPLNPGNVLRTSGGNKVDINGQEQWVSGFSYTMPAAQEMYYVFGRDYFPEAEEAVMLKYNDTNLQSLFTAATKKVVTLRAHKTVSIDVHGNENVAFTDTDGKTLAVARSGEGATTTDERTVLSIIGEQGFIDIHIPSGVNSNTITYLGGESNYKVYNLKTGSEITYNLTGLSPGVYRIEAVNKSIEPPFTYIDHTTGTIEPASSGLKGVSYKVNYYDFSLNYYDKTGRLKKSLQPIGYNNSYNLAQSLPVHNNNLESEYKYNTEGQLIYLLSPDEGEAWFKYRNDGQIRFSQNSKQAADNEFSYTNYDQLGRPVESGVFTENSTYYFDPNSSTTPLDNIIDNTYTIADYQNDSDDLPNSNCSEQHFSVYDKGETVLVDAETYNQSFISGNVAKTYTINPATTTTWYSYDIHGRITWMIQDVNGLGKKVIEYEYDDVTGLVSKVYYQRGNATEQFVHKYTYNVVSQLVKVETSTDDATYLTHATYEYYETGGLKRIELAPDSNGNPVQGIDYVYNLNGQLKSINHPSLQAAKDPGGDANDIFGVALDYHSNDYKRQNTGIESPALGENLFDGNITSMRWNSTFMPAGTANQYAYSYQYNRNNWLKNAFYGIYNSTNGAFNSGAAGDYRVSGLQYDANGNILQLNRNKHTENGTNAMDQLSYNYDYNTSANKLLWVDDAVTGTTYADDIKDQDAGNYEYNVIGQLEKNNGEDVAYIYNTSGLVTEVKKVSNGEPIVKFYYNDRGQRVRKESFTNGILDNTQYYVRDASGSPLAIYNNTNIAEHTIYGSGRLGVFYKNSSATNTSIYQLTDHLGNVRALVGRETGEREGATDYYPFGMVMPGRDENSALNKYRYAYQGQEKDDETGKEAFQLRLWDSRIGRWLTTDPYGQYNSPYLGMGNDPINGIDPDGGWWQEFFNWLEGNGWNSNAALEFKSNGGELGDWIGDKFTGYRKGFFDDNEGGSGIAAFTAVQDHKFNFLGQEFEFYLEGTFRFSVGLQIGLDLNDLVAFDLDAGSVDIMTINTNRSGNYLDNVKFGPKENSVINGHGRYDFKQSVGVSGGFGVKSFGTSEYSSGSQSLEFKNWFKERGIQLSGSIGLISARVKYTHDRLNNINYLEIRAGEKFKVKTVFGIEYNADMVVKTKF